MEWLASDPTKDLTKRHHHDGFSQLRPREVFVLQRLPAIATGDSALGNAAVLRPNPSAGCLYEGRSLPPETLNQLTTGEGLQRSGRAVITCLVKPMHYHLD
jgi:hypothetical protein